MTRRALDPGPCVHAPYGWDCATCHDDPPGDLCPRCGRTRPDARYPWAGAKDETERAEIIRGERREAQTRREQT